MKYTTKFILPGLLLLLFCSSAAAQGGMMPGPGTVHSAGGGTPPTIDATNITGNDGGGFPAFTLSVTTGSGANRLLVVYVSWVGGDATTSAAVTYGVQAMTQLGSSFANGSLHGEVWYLAAPTTGTANVSVVWTNGMSGKSLVAIPWTDANQAAPLGTLQTATGNSTTPSVDVSSSSSEVVLDFLNSSLAGLATAGAGQTLRYQLQDDMGAASSTEPGSATTTMSWTNSSEQWLIAAMAVKGV